MFHVLFHLESKKNHQKMWRQPFSQWHPLASPLPTSFDM
jgi:hypothetical protein